MSQLTDNSDARTELNEEDRIANIQLNGQFRALQLYTGSLVWNHPDGERVYDIEDWTIVDISLGEDETQVEECDRHWVADQLNGVGDYQIISANAVSEIVIVDSIGVEFTVSLDLERIN